MFLKIYCVMLMTCLQQECMLVTVTYTAALFLYYYFVIKF